MLRQVIERASCEDPCFTGALLGPGLCQNSLSSMASATVAMLAFDQFNICYCLRISIDCVQLKSVYNVYSSSKRCFFFFF